ncbi:MAG: hypothetical protein M3R59_06505 [Verrucomicrobiota bacterium]|nr:hypothetical protein [Verrucomicrobiota bacterium]
MSGEEMHLSLTIGHIAGGVGIGLALIGLGLSVRRHDYRWLPFYAAVLLIHPAWTVSVRNGDCGLAKRFLAVVASLLILAALSMQISAVSRQRFLRALCIASWVLFLPVFLPLHRLEWSPVSLLERSGHHDETWDSVVRGYVFSERYLFVTAIALTIVYLATALRRKIMTQPGAS